MRQHSYGVVKPQRSVEVMGYGMDEEPAWERLQTPLQCQQELPPRQPVKPQRSVDSIGSSQHDPAVPSPLPASAHTHTANI